MYFLNQRTHSILFLCLFLLTSICIFTPFSPAMPGDALDASWVFGINQAVAQKLSFGRDIIFTFGPYAAIYSKAYHPAIDTLILCAALYFGIFFGILVFLNFRNSPNHLKLFLLIALAGLVNSRDALFLYYPLLLSFYCFQSKQTNPLSLAALFSPLGLLVLIKGSFITFCVATLLLSSIHLRFKKDRVSTILIWVLPSFSLLFFWVLSGQQLSALPEYFSAMGPITSGYIEAMAMRGNLSEIIIYAMTSGLLLWTLFKATQTDTIRCILYLCILTLGLFIASKAGFIRHDGHEVIASSFLLLSALLVHAHCNTSRTCLILLTALIAMIYIDHRHSPHTVQGTAQKITGQYEWAWHGLTTRISNPGVLEKKFHETTQAIHTVKNLPHLDGTADIHSYGQSYLLASQNKWRPRPVFQSYSAYTPTLIEKNRAHLLSQHAPDHLIFKVESIDNRMPALDDGASWPVMLSYYTPTQLQHDLLILKRNTAAAHFSQHVLSKKTYHMQQTVKIPDVNQPIFVKITIKPTLLGKLSKILLKPVPIRIDLTTKDGALHQYRLISSMTQTGFLLSPLIENTTEFHQLYTYPEHLTDKKVSAFSIRTRTLIWQANYDVELIALDLPMQSNRTQTT